MTVIAYFSDLGIALSDVMLSVDSPGGHIRLPSTGDTALLGYPLGLSPTRLVRKFARVTYHQQTGTFLVAGTLSHVESLFSNIRLILSDSSQIPQDFRSTVAPSGVYHLIDAACHITDASGCSNYSIIGFLGGNLFAKQEGGVVKEKIPYFGETFISGSGAKALLEILLDLGAKYIDQFGADESQQEKKHRTLSRVTRHLFSKDNAPNSQTLMNGVGGYYEQHELTKTGLAPVDSVLTLLGSVLKLDHRKHIEVQKLLFHCYISDWLVIAEFEGGPKRFYAGSRTTIDINQIYLHKIPPVFTTNKEPEILLSAVLLKLQNAKHHNLSLRCSIDGKEKEVGISESFSEVNLLVVECSGKISISLNEEKFVELCQRVNVLSKQ